jgi:uncharacterized membrane protein YkvI
MNRIPAFLDRYSMPLMMAATIALVVLIMLTWDPIEGFRLFHGMLTLLIVILVFTMLKRV